MDLGDLQSSALVGGWSQRSDIQLGSALSAVDKARLVWR